VDNALLLRADVHNLFDLGLLTITSKMTTAVDQTVTEKAYRALDGRSIAMPTGASAQALRRAVTLHRRLHGK
jgi:putative restriction endonuclease